MRNDAVIVGWGHTRFGRMDALSLEDLIAAAAREAIQDAGISIPAWCQTRSRPR